jgi:hypothetical protein
MPARASFKLRDDDFAARFRIGAEFELFASRHRGSSSGRGTYSLRAAERDILNLLSARHPRVKWAKLLSFVPDVSLWSPDRSTAAVEIVMAHRPGPEALVRIGQILSSLSSAPWIFTDAQTGFHLNASFADPKLNAPAILARVHETTPVAEILSRFGRSRNDYCKHNARYTLNTCDMFTDNGQAPQSSFADALGRACGAGQKHKISIAEAERMILALSNPAKLAAFQRIAMAHARALILESWNEDRPACAARIHHNADIARRPMAAHRANYMEFRMMGGAGYHERLHDLAGSIQQCLVGMTLAARRPFALGGPPLATPPKRRLAAA